MWTPGPGTGGLRWLVVTTWVIRTVAKPGVSVRTHQTSHDGVVVTHGTMDPPRNTISTPIDQVYGEDLQAHRVMHLWLYMG